MKRWELAILLGLALSLAVGSMTGFARQCGEVRDNTIRLHILANSDSEEDQALKLRVRDALLEEIAPLLARQPDKERAVEEVWESLPRIRAVAEAALRANGCDAPVEAQVVNMYFATRRYGRTEMPAGRYDAVRITIGEGAGHNWWCVMFPPLCLPAAQEQPEGAPELIPAAPEYQVKFAVVELWEGLQERLREPEDTPAKGEHPAEEAEEPLWAAEAAASQSGPAAPGQ